VSDGLTKRKTGKEGGETKTKKGRFGWPAKVLGWGNRKKRKK